ncbi:hypothetical protein H4R34_005239 [Dimargaris verticillata]|uniref:AP-2 complex subunit alpha n=1 Tax=Dimargaris verticillata TaxID=2761393 RepID=A0A9W8B100_9FUNG|nr:hypothetical protein H4R34_005239 [Dimargaris verticillata]
MSMRGLTVFIADLRKCRIRELEEKRINKELANIRVQFKDPSLNGYQKKKYVCKLLYIYILGWEIDFGHAEAVNLISSSKFSEKQMGYLALTLLLTENSDFIRLVINSLRKDLDDANEIFNCLALHAIANIGGREMAETLSGEVQKLLVSPLSRSFVKKKAALCLLRLFRKHSDVLPAVEWAGRLLPIMDDPNLGVATSMASLITALAQQYPQQYSPCVPKALRRLCKIVVDREVVADYVYYKVPAPWLQVKLLRLLQYYPAPNDENLRDRLSSILQCIVQNSREIPRNIQHANALHAILFEAINLIIHLGCEPELQQQAAFLLGRFIASKETNVRYLGLETMAHLAGTLDDLTPIKRHQELILMSLRDRDVSVRRRGLDLLYSMCDVTNAKVVVKELLRYLPMADYTLREEMVLKVAILTEKFATEYQWYIDNVMRLLSTAGDQVGEEIWYRVVQIILNNEDLQEYAARIGLSTLRSPSCHENALKVAAYVLGEFGHLIANDSGCSPLEQFKALHARFAAASMDTKFMLLTTYLKFVNLFPEIKDHCTRVFERYRYTLNVELQQRACEYYAIAAQDTDDLLQTVCEEMPPFPERESALVSRLHRQHLDTEDKRTWVVGGKEANRELRSQDGQVVNAQARAVGTIIANATAAAAAAAATDATGNRDGKLLTAGTSHTAETDLLQLDAEDEVTHAAGVDGPKAIMASSAREMSSPLEQATEGSGYTKLYTTAQGVLYEDEVIQLGLKSEYQGHQGRLVVYTGNLTGDVLNSFTMTVHSAPNIKATTVQEAPGLIQPFAQAPFLLNVECQGIFTSPPVVHITYARGSHGRQSISDGTASASGASPASLYLKLPVVLTKFVEPFAMSVPDFFARWKQIGSGTSDQVAQYEAQSIFKAQETIDMAVVRKLFKTMGYHLLSGADQNDDNLVAIGIFSTLSEKMGSLVRLEPSLEHQMYRITVRSTAAKLSQPMAKQLESAVSQTKS